MTGISVSIGPNATITAQKVAQTLDIVGNMLVEKNKAYGDSAINPIRIFSDAGTTAQIKVRIDDKLSRIQRGSAAGEDVILDLIGYLILLYIAEGNV